MQVRIKNVSPAQLGHWQVHKLKQLTFGYDGQMLEAFHHLLTYHQDSAVIFIAETIVDKDIVGWCMLDLSTRYLPRSDSEYKETAHILMTYVDYKYRRLGIGSQLFQAAKQKFTYEFIPFGVLPGIDGSETFFNKNGASDRLMAWEHLPVTIDV